MPRCKADEKEVSGSRYEVSVPNRMPTQGGTDENIYWIGLGRGLIPETRHLIPDKERSRWAFFNSLPRRLPVPAWKRSCLW